MAFRRVFAAGVARKADMFVVKNRRVIELARWRQTLCGVAAKARRLVLGPLVGRAFVGRPPLKPRSLHLRRTTIERIVFRTCLMRTLTGMLLPALAPRMHVRPLALAVRLSGRLLRWFVDGAPWASVSASWTWRAKQRVGEIAPARGFRGATCLALAPERSSCAR